VVDVKREPYRVFAFFGMDRQEEIEYLVSVCCRIRLNVVNNRILQDPTLYRDRLAHRLLELGATSEKRAIKLTIVGSWAVRCKGKLKTTLGSDPSARFIIASSDPDSCVYLNSQPASSLPAMTSGSSLLADSAIANALSAIDGSSSEEDEGPAKRPLMAADKRRKIRKVIQTLTV
jgi:hypothetical protein